MTTYSRKVFLLNLLFIYKYISVSQSLAYHDILHHWYTENERCHLDIVVDGEMRMTWYGGSHHRVDTPMIQRLLQLREVGEGGGGGGNYKM